MRKQRSNLNNISHFRSKWSLEQRKENIILRGVLFDWPHTKHKKPEQGKSEEVDICYCKWKISPSIYFTFLMIAKDTLYNIVLNMLILFALNRSFKRN